jgi:hypothetical protein
MIWIVVGSPASTRTKKSRKAECLVDVSGVEQRLEREHRVAPVVFEVITL